VKQVTIYSDGSSLGNPGFGGWGTILKYNNHTKEICGGDRYTTNNQMELMGVIQGLKLLKEPCEVKLISDSRYVVQSINQWLDNWVKNNWKTASKKPVKNQDLWQQYLKVAKQHKIKAIWIKAHNGHIENERCDMLAKNFALKLSKK
jgi:ribonuclease HI